MSMLAFLPFITIISAVLVLIFPKNLSGVIGTLGAFGSLLVAYLCFAHVQSLGEIHWVGFEWLPIAETPIRFSLFMDGLSSVMCMLITGVGSLIHLYSVGYMSHDEGRKRYFILLNLFFFFMLTLVLGSNFPVLFIGWEGVGVCSYLLIGYWFDTESFVNAGKKAFVVNRIGDIGLLVAMFLLLQQTGTLEFSELKKLWSEGNFLSPEYAFLVAGAVFFGATGKSAQIPLFVWLPDAMAGPTPVSALIHAATMVTAGVYLLARMDFLYMVAPEMQLIILMVAVLTAFVAATTALVQNDLKKVLAYSTVSQLGFMFVACATSSYGIALFHVLTHAFFKACLFLSAGTVIHAADGEQDMRRLGGLSKYLPVTFICFIVSVMSIAGIFPFSGYFSKHAIFEALATNTNTHIVPHVEFFSIALNLTAFLTAIYMMRALCLTFLGEYKGKGYPHEGGLVMTLPVVTLALLGAIGGYLLSQKLPGYLGRSLIEDFYVSHTSLLEGVEGSSIGIVGVVLGFLFFRRGAVPETIFTKTPFTYFLKGKWFFDECYEIFIIQPLSFFSQFLSSFVDGSLISGTIKAISGSVSVSGELVKAIQSGSLRGYIFFFLSAASLMLMWFVVG